MRILGFSCWTAVLGALLVPGSLAFLGQPSGAPALVGGLGARVGAQGLGRLGIRGEQRFGKLRAANVKAKGVIGLRAEGGEPSLGWRGRPGSSIPGGPPSVRQVEPFMSEVETVNIDGTDIQLEYLPGESPTIFYLPALNQTRHGTKAATIKTWARRTGRSYMVADYFGMGRSGGDYKDACVSKWAHDTAALIDWVKKEKDQDKVILVGAGVGGWVMVHAARAMQENVVGLVGIAADPDFTELLVWPALEQEVKDKVMSEGIADIEWAGNPYTISRALIEDGRKMMLLDKGHNSIDLQCPIRLIQGLGDEEIPPERALELSDCIKGTDVVITYVKFGKHGLEDYESDFKRIYAAIEDINRTYNKAMWLRNMNRPV